MPKSCVAFGCTNHNMMGKSGLTFHIFPDKQKKKEKWEKWVQAVKRVNADGSRWYLKGTYVYLCSEHFVSGRPSSDPSHPDFIPSVFKFKTEDNEKKKRKLARYESAKKRAKTKYVDEEQSSSALPTVDAPEEKAFDILESKETTINQEMEINFLQMEKKHLMTKVSLLEQQAMLSNYNPEVIKDNDDASKYLTGLPWRVFEMVCGSISSLIAKPCKNLPPQNQVLLVLVRLRLNLPFEYLSMQTGLSQSTIHATFQKVIDMLYGKLKFLIHWPDRESIRKTLPPIFQANFPRMTSIIDCFEIFIERPGSQRARAQVYSNYEKHSTVKFFISCSPLGATTFLSPAWGGRATDNEIVRDSGFISIKYHLPGDQILADRGFTLVDDFVIACNAELIIPYFTKGKSQLSAKEVEVTRKIANVRIHIERVIGQMKQRFAILSQGSLPLSLIKSKTNSANNEIPNVEKLVTVCACLNNLTPSIVYNENTPDKQSKL